MCAANMATASAAAVPGKRRTRFDGVGRRKRRLRCHSVKFLCLMWLRLSCSAIDMCIPKDMQ